MHWGGSSPIWPDYDPAARFAVDIDIPYADENRNHVLRREWQHQAGDQVPAPPLTLPRRSEGSYKVRIRLDTMLDIGIEEQYSDAVAGRTGGPNGHHEDRIVTHFTLGGEWRFSSERQTWAVGAGLLCARRNDEPWDFEVSRGTRALALVLPAQQIRFPARGSAIMAEYDAPAARLLLAQLRTWSELSDDIDPITSMAAHEATVQLFQGLLDGQLIDDDEFSPALVRAAMEHIERRLLTDPDLGPRAIAISLHVSVRTLHRAFARENISVMGYVRGRRLERARADLTSSALTVAEVAARWHFTDSSHFTRAYKKRFDRTPAADRRG